MSEENELQSFAYYDDQRNELVHYHTNQDDPEDKILNTIAFEHKIFYHKQGIATSYELGKKLFEKLFIFDLAKDIEGFKFFEKAVLSILFN